MLVEGLKAICTRMESLHKQMSIHSGDSDKLTSLV